MTEQTAKPLSDERLDEMDHDLNTAPVGMDKAYPLNRSFRHDCIARKLLAEVHRQRDEIARLEGQARATGTWELDTLLEDNQILREKVARLEAEVERLKRESWEYFRQEALDHGMPDRGPYTEEVASGND